MNSVVKQDFIDFEWIVVDGGSNDGSKDFLAAIKDTRLRWISEPDKGIFDAMNKGITLSRGKYCIFMNAGDQFANHSVLSESAFHIQSQQHASLIYGDTIEDARDKRVLKMARRPSTNIYSMFTHHQSIFYKREAIEGGYDLAYRYSADWALTTRILSKDGVKTLYLSKPISIFERGGISQRDDVRKTINSEHWRILRQEAGLNLFSALSLYWIKTRMNYIRRISPRLYDKFRFKSFTQY